MSPDSNEFPENFRTAFGPPPPAPFSEKILWFFPQTGCTSTKFAMKFFRSEMTPPLFWSFSGNSWQKKPFQMQKKLQWNCLDRKWPPPLSEIFRKFIRFRGDSLPKAFWHSRWYQHLRWLYCNKWCVCPSWSLTKIKSSAFKMCVPTGFYSETMISIENNFVFWIGLIMLSWRAHWSYYKHSSWHDHSS